MTNSAIHSLKRKLTRIQLAIWAIFYVFLLLYTMQKWEYPSFSFWAASIASATYLIAVYGNSSWLIPRFYAKSKLTYFGLSILLLAFLLLSRMWVEHKILLPLHSRFYDWTLSHFSFVFITNFLAFGFGALLRVSLDYLTLLQTQEELKTRQMSAELNLLKSQVQPHFLYNTLNNIYYLAYTKNEKTPEVIAKLSDIMRYFTDEAPKEKVPLANEIQFLQNYIELEQIRMLHPVDLKFNIEVSNKAVMIPPMLFIPLVENIFKHGVDKTVQDNVVEIWLREQQGKIVFTAGNRVGTTANKSISGVGLMNLRKRMELLYGDDFEFITDTRDAYFSSTLKFPV